MLYDGDILDEEVILKWAGKPNKKHVSKSVLEELHEKAKRDFESIINEYVLLYSQSKF